MSEFELLDDKIYDGFGEHLATVEIYDTVTQEPEYYVKTVQFLSVIELKKIASLLDKSNKELKEVYLKNLITQQPKSGEIK